MQKLNLDSELLKPMREQLEIIINKLTGIVATQNKEAEIVLKINLDSIKQFEEVDDEKVKEWVEPSIEYSISEKIKEVKNTNKGNLGFDYQVKVDEETNETYRQNFKIAFFELRKAVNELSKTKEVETLNLSGLTARDQWALFINSDQKEVYEKLVEESKTFEEAYERLKKASSDETLMAMYRNREKAIRDWNDSINSARKDGEQRVNALYEKLLQENRGSEIPKAIADPTFRAKLFNEYGI